MDFTDPTFLNWLLHCAVISATISLTGVAVALSCGYLIPRAGRLRGNLGVGGLVLPQLIPFVVLLIPLYAALIRMNLLNTFLVLLGIYAATAFPLCVFHFIRVYNAIPIAMEESASLDGCSNWKRWYGLLLPLIGSTILFTAILSFLIVCSGCFGFALNGGGDVLPTLNVRTSGEVVNAAVLCLSTAALALFLSELILFRRSRKSAASIP